MKLCKKCKVAIDDMTDGCAKCKPWKENWLVEDVAGNSVFEEINAMRRSVRQAREALDHKRTMNNRGRVPMDDAELTQFIKDMDNLTRAYNRLFSMVQSLKKEGVNTWAKMSVADQTKAIARILVTKSKEDRRKILGLADEMEREIVPHAN